MQNSVSVDSNHEEEIICKFDLEDKSKICMVKGLPSNLVTKLLDYSKNDEIIKQNTSDAKRFATLEAFNEWLKKDRDIYTITDKKKEKLMGILWFGFRPLLKEKIKVDDIYSYLKLDNFCITVSYRLYKDLRGKRMFTKIFKEAFNHFKQSKTYKELENKNQNDFWLETNSDNTNSLMAMQKLGFKIIGKNHENGRVFLVYSNFLLNK